MSRIKEKNIYIMKKNFGTEPKIGYCPLSMRLGAGAQAWAGMGAGGRAGRWAQARVAGVQTGAQGVLALGVGVGARAAGGRGAQALGRAGARQGERRARQGERARGWASGRAAGRTVRAGHGRQAARARSLCAQAGLLGCSCTRLGFQPGFSTRYFS